MNSMGTAGKNLPNIPVVGDVERVREIALLWRPATSDTSTRVFSSSAPRERMPLTSPPAQLPEPHPARKYGGRKLRYRHIDELKEWQVDDWYAADVAAAQLGLPLETFVTVNYHAAGDRPGAMAATFKKAMKRMAQWFRDNGCPIAYLYVHENPLGERPNSHILVHVPRHLRRAFEVRSAGWFNAMDGGVDISARNDFTRLVRRLGTRLNYMAKGAPDLTCRRYGGRRKKDGQGPIDFKRAGVSEYLRSTPEFTEALQKRTGQFREQYARARSAAREKGVHRSRKQSQ